MVPLLALLTVSSPICAQQEANGLLTDTLEIRFKLDSVLVNMHFDDNMRRWDTFERNFRRRFDGLNPMGVKIDIYSGASPEGTVEHNRWLGQERGESIRRLIEQRLRGRVGYIVIHNEAARWQGLYDAVAASDEPWRDEALGIIRQPARVTETGNNITVFVKMAVKTCAENIYVRMSLFKSL